MASDGRMLRRMLPVVGFKDDGVAAIVAGQRECRFRNCLFFLSDWSMCGERERHLISRFFFFFFIFLGEKIEEFSALAWWDEMKIARNAAIMACDELGDKFEKFVEMVVQFFFLKKSEKFEGV